YVQKGRIVAGSYDYRLKQGTVSGDSHNYQQQYGLSDKNAFIQKGRIVAGSYDYRLKQYGLSE
ncbi:hypothetical protein PS003_23970, partial [Shigella sonnei]|nr:hypothetical protein [Shigella sonnei]